MTFYGEFKMLIPKSSNPVKPKLTWRERAIAFLAPEEKPKLEAQAAERERVAAEENAARANVEAKEAWLGEFKKAHEYSEKRPMGERELAKLAKRWDDHRAGTLDAAMLERISPRTMQGTDQMVDQWNQAAREYQDVANFRFKQT
jgi:hypothetical protein